MANIQFWNVDRVVNEPLSSLETANINQRHRACDLFVSYFYFLSQNDVNQYPDIRQVGIDLRNTLDMVQKSHWEERANRLNTRPVPVLLPVWPDGDLPILSLLEIVLESLKKDMNYFAETV